MSVGMVGKMVVVHQGACAMRVIGKSGGLAEVYRAQPAPSLAVDVRISAMCRIAIRGLVTDTVRMASDPYNPHVVRESRTFPEVGQNVGHDLVLLGLFTVDYALHKSGVGVDNDVRVEINDRFRRFHLCQEEKESLNDGL